MTDKLVAIVGPTASGKSALAMEVARQFNGEIICADSRTVYKGMDIGTAKPTPEDQALVPHHLLDVVEPGQPFSAAQFKELAEASIVDITAKGKLSVLVGGTGLYIDSILFNYQFGEAANPEVRESLNALDTDKLRQLCIDTGLPLPENNSNRRHLVRAIELGGLINSKRVLRPHTVVVGIATSRELLRQRITARAEIMFKQGVVQEAKELGKRYGWESEAMTGNMYRILSRVIEGTITIEQAKELFIQSDMRLVKRQMTWFKRNPYIVWDADPSILLELIEQFVITGQRNLLKTVPAK